LLLTIEGSYFFPLPFEIEDFDEDNDLDVFVNVLSGFLVYENESTQIDSFQYNDSIYVATDGFLYMDLLDVDSDGDLDIVTSSIYNQDEFIYLENNNTISLFPFDTIFQPFDLNIDIDSSGKDLSAEFVDIDGDGNLDLLLQGNFDENDLVDPYGYYSLERRLYYHKNLSSTGFQFDPMGEKLIDRDLYTYPDQNDITSFESTYFIAVDIDNDGDYDIHENFSRTQQACGYCGTYSSMKDILIYKNVIEEITGIYNNQSTLELEILGNPTHDKSILQFKNESQSEAELKIYSSTGVLVEHLKSNQSSFIINRKNLANGIYIYSLTLDGKAASGKLVFN
jgi:hypothetical protein